MTAPAPVLCPTCGDEWMPDHPAGLVFQHTNECTLRAHEDSTAVADAERARVVGPTFVRQATATERTLLAPWGQVPATLRCHVSYLSPAVRRRTFTTR